MHSCGALLVRRVRQNLLAACKDTSKSKHRTRANYQKNHSKPLSPRRVAVVVAEAVRRGRCCGAAEPRCGRLVCRSGFLRFLRGGFLVRGGLLVRSRLLARDLLLDSLLRLRVRCVRL